MSTFIVNEYIINRKRIGKGSFSTIYKGYSTKNNQVYAIKEIVVDKKQNKSLVKRELSVLKTLDHPSIVKLHDVIIDTNYNNIYFVLDYYPKGDFAKFLDNKPLKEKFSRKYYLKKLIKEIGISKIVFWKGYSKNIFTEIKNMDLLVLPSIKDESFENNFTDSSCCCNKDTIDKCNKYGKSCVCDYYDKNKYLCQNAY